MVKLVDITDEESARKKSVRDIVSSLEEYFPHSEFSFRFSDGSIEVIYPSERELRATIHKVIARFNYPEKAFWIFEDSFFRRALKFCQNYENQTKPPTELTLFSDYSDSL